MLLEDSEEGIIQRYNPDVKLLGAVNREGVTCYLDALLFAMFARLGSFEAMLYNNFEDSPRKRLATLLRLWVNTLRAGKLITTDIVCVTRTRWIYNRLIILRQSKFSFNYPIAAGKRPSIYANRTLPRPLPSLPRLWPCHY